MNNKLMWVVVGVIVVAAAAWVAFGGSGGESPEQAMNTGGETQQSLKDILAKGGSHKCEFKDETAAGKTEGAVYMASGKMRGDFSAVSGGQTFNGHMVTMDNTVYTWMDGASTGVKIAFDADAAAESDNNQGLDANKKLDYRCESWSADSAKFVLPSNVTFSDLGALVGGSAGMNAAGSVSAGTAAQCSACDSAGAYKEQCRAALGCK